MDDPRVPDDVAFKIELPTFEGPLDLLLHLIRKHELDILDLPISFVTERYLQYLKLMQELDLDVASEYLLMAATLAHIKSRSLLPPSEEEQDDEIEEYMEDPRAELIRRLLEYQKYKEAGDALGDRAIAGRDVFGRGTPAPVAEGEPQLAEVGLFKLLDAFEAILKRAKGRVALEVTTERISIQDRIGEITDLLREKQSCTFEALFGEEFTRYDVVVTLLALLEMTRMQLLRLYQADPAAPLHIQYALLDAAAPTIPPEAPDAPDAPDAGTDAAQTAGDDHDTQPHAGTTNNERATPGSAPEAEAEADADPETNAREEDELESHAAQAEEAPAEVAYAGEVAPQGDAHAGAGSGNAAPQDALEEERDA